MLHEKTAEFDGFDRPWPNIVTASPETIKKVDENWEKWGLGDFLPSPSLKYIKQLYPGDAVAE
jgi:4-hydroxy-3-polyprenylbenzoate decarboxylase